MFTQLVNFPQGGAFQLQRIPFQCIQCEKTAPVSELTGAAVFEAELRIRS
jgi:hypothetical protein